MDRQKYGETGRQMERYAGKRTNKNKDKQTDRQTNIWQGKLTNRKIIKKMGTDRQKG